MTGKIRGDRNFVDDVTVLGSFRENLYTTESFTMSIDPSGGTRPPAGTCVRNQAEYDTLGYDLKLIQDAFDIVPKFLGHAITVMLKSGDHLAVGNEVSDFYKMIAVVPELLSATRYMFFLTNPYIPGIVFIGESETVLEAEQAGNSTSNTITPTVAPGWTINEYRGKLVRIDTGADAGRVLPIAANDASSITTSATINTIGAVTFTIYEPDAYILPSTDGVNKDCTDFTCFGKAFDTQRQTAAIEFQNCQFGRTSFEMGSIDLNGMRLNIKTSIMTVDASRMLFNGHSIPDSAFLQIWDSVIKLGSGSTGVALRYGMTQGQIYHTYVYGPGTYGFQLGENSQLFLIDVLAEDMDYFVRGYGGSLDLTSGVLYNGGGLGTGVYAKQSNNEDFYINGTLTLNNCAIGVYAADDTGIYMTNPIIGSGNTVGYKLEGAARIIVPGDPSGLVAATELSVDGIDHDYSELGAADDAITGVQQSQIVRI